MSTSLQMQKRLDKIQGLIDEGYNLEKKFGFPVLKTSEGKSKSVGGINSPTGFSWIGFFFPFVVCTQIREWSYFYINGIILIVISLVSLKLNPSSDLYTGSQVGIGVMYGFYYPYLRYLANEKGIKEIPILISIFLGIILTFLCALPSAIIDSIAEL